MCLSLCHSSCLIAECLMLMPHTDLPVAGHTRAIGKSLAASGTKREGHAAEEDG